MWWRDERRRVEHARGHHRQHPVDVPDHVGVPRLQRQRLDPDDPHVDLDALGVDADGRDTVPALRVTRAASSSASGWPTASIAASTPRPPVAAFTAARGSSSVRCTGLGAERRARSPSRSSTVSIAITFAAPAALRRLDRAEPDRAEPEHRRRVARPDARLVDRVPAGAHHVAGEQRGVVGHALGHAAQREVRVRDQHLLGLRALERAERLAVAEDPPLVALVEVARGGRRSTSRRRSSSSPARGRPRPPRSRRRPRRPRSRRTRGRA